MPIYVYQCADCDTQIEKRQGFSDAPLTTCETCGGSVRRVLQPVGIIFKGSGFYSTDNSVGSNGKKENANDEAKPATSDSSAAPAGESKSDSGDKPATSAKESGPKAGSAKESSPKAGSANGSGSSSASSAPAASTSSKS